MSKVVGKYELGRVLGAADFDCRIRVCTHIVTGNVFAVKIYDKTILAEYPWMWSQIREAVQVMRTLPKHDNLVEMVECFETTSSLYILMQLVSGTHLTKMYVSSHQDVPLHVTKTIFEKIINGIAHMHRHGIVHLGIAPDHVLITEEQHVKISFLVMCRVVPRGTKLNRMCGTTHTVAPEILEGGPYDPYKADAWSCGIVLFFMLNGGRYPFDSANTTRNILRHNMRRLNYEVPPAPRDLVHRLLDSNPETRLDVLEVLSHPWFTSGDGVAPAAPQAEAQPKLAAVARSIAAHASNLTLDTSKVGSETKTRSASFVDTKWDEATGGLQIKLPPGLSRNEEAALIIQNTWRVMKDRRDVQRVKADPTHLDAGVTRVSVHRSASTLVRGSTGSPLISLGSPQCRSKGSMALNENSRSNMDDVVLRVPEEVEAPSKEYLAFHQCPMCGRLPPPRVIGGKPPYPAAKLKYLNGQYVETAALEGVPGRPSLTWHGSH